MASSFYFFLPLLSNMYCTPTEAQAQLWEEQREATKTAKKALLRVMESEGTTPEQILRATELLAQIGKW